MPLEATMLIMDNSEYMRNGDYPPTRFEAQGDAVNIVFQTKTDSHPENNVGVMTMAGKGPEVLVTSAREVGQVLQAIHKASSTISGVADIPTAINVAQLALKHRSNKNARQRIVVFTGSPLEGPNTDEKNFTNLARKLKKNNIAVDIVCFGDGIEETETPALKTFVDGVNSGDNSHYVSITPDKHRLLSEAVSHSAILAADRGAVDEAMADITNTAGPSGAGGAFGELGIDPNLDPELAMALRMSLEEENARQAAAGVANATSATVEPSAQPPSSSSAPAPVAATGTAIDQNDLDEDAALQQALALSQQSSDEDVEMGDHHIAPATTDAAIDDDDMDEEEAIARAIQMSMESQQDEEQKK